MPRVPLVCRICAKPYAAQECRAAKSKYCSRTCASEGSRQRTGSLSHSWRGGKCKRTCLVCMAPFEVVPADAKRGYDKTCSVKCRSAHVAKLKQGIRKSHAEANARVFANTAKAVAPYSSWLNRPRNGFTEYMTTEVPRMRLSSFGERSSSMNSGGD